MVKVIISNVGFAMFVVSCLVAIGSSIAMFYLHFSGITGKNYCKTEKANPTGDQDFTCEDGWMLFKTSRQCYKLFQLAYDWPTANKFCEEQGFRGSLVTISNNETQAFVESMGNEWIWIGGRKVEGSWEWKDGTPWSKDWNNWKSGEPNPDEKAEEIYIRLDDQFKWNDWPRTTLSWFICQYQV